MKDYKRLLEIHDELQDALCTTIKISHGQVTDITVKDLISKYKSTIKNKHHCMESFKTVLLYYLHPDELDELMTDLKDI